MRDGRGATVTVTRACALHRARLAPFFTDDRGTRPVQVGPKGLTTSRPRGEQGLMWSIVKTGAFIVLAGASLASAQLAPPPAPPSLASPPVPLSVSGREAQGTSELSGDIGADLTIAFE